MSVTSDALVRRGTPTNLASGDPAVSDCYPAWLDNLADEVTIEGSMLDDRDKATSWDTRLAQYDAVSTWGIPDHALLQMVRAIEADVRHQRRQ